MHVLHSLAKPSRQESGIFIQSFDYTIEIIFGMYLPVPFCDQASLMRETGVAEVSETAGRATRLRPMTFVQWPLVQSLFADRRSDRCSYNSRLSHRTLKHDFHIQKAIGHAHVKKRLGVLALPDSHISAVMSLRMIVNGEKAATLACAKIPQALNKALLWQWFSISLCKKVAQSCFIVVDGLSERRPAAIAIQSVVAPFSALMWIENFEDQIRYRSRMTSLREPSFITDDKRFPYTDNVLQPLSQSCKQ